MELKNLNGTLLKTRIYCGLYEKEIIPGGQVKEYCYIAGGKGITAVMINNDLYYLRRDHQGSITGVIDENSTVVESYSYDAWGRRRNPNDWSYCGDFSFSSVKGKSFFPLKMESITSAVYCAASVVRSKWYFTRASHFST